MKLKDRVAIITGATSGIGEASALLFAEEGARVTVTGRDEARGRSVVSAIVAAGGTAIFVRADVRLAGDCDRVVTETSRAFGGRLDILFNNAGVFHPHNAVDCTEEEWDATVDSSLKGAWLMAKYCLPVMIAQQRDARGRRSGQRQVLVREAHDHGSLADGGGDAVHRSRSNVARGEHSRHAGFEGKRLALLLPRPRIGFGRHQVAAGEDEPLRVAQHAVR